MGSYRSPAVALMPDMTPKELRSTGNAVINLMGAVGGIFALAMISLLISKSGTPNYLWVFLAVALFMVISVLVLTLTIKENKLSKEIRAEAIVDEEGLSDDRDHEMPKDVKRSLNFILASIFLWFTAYNAVTTAFSRYAKGMGIKGGSFANALMVAMAAAIVSFIPVGIISVK